MSSPAPPALRRVLGIGIATLDIVNEVAAYPEEDDEVRALAQHRRLGGNVANTLDVLRQLGHGCAWCGTLADDPESDEVFAGLRDRGIDSSRARRPPGSRTPTSYVTLSRQTGSRTIVHHRRLRELEAADFRRVPLDGLDWAHFEGRNPEETAAMLRDCAARRPDLTVSVEIEKPRPDIEVLLAGPRVVILSRVFALAAGCQDPRAFLADQWGRTSAELLCLPWGAEGAYAQFRDGRPVFAPAHAPAVVRDTLGAGDVFNAAIIDGVLAGLSLSALLARANRLAGHKCGQLGLQGVVASARAAGLL
jgi:ketohexokinase